MSELIEAECALERLDLLNDCKLELIMHISTGNGRKFDTFLKPFHRDLVWRSFIG